MPYSNAQKRKYQREWCAKNRAAYMDGKTCAHCGSPGPLEVDHRRANADRAALNKAKKRAREIREFQTSYMPAA